ncbi:hypothetical protein RO3G_04816 [Rhizopus delemar RA 99-880]|uniref:Uncharacterized protein n=1 Tax=Rhizopus delemar (strain RA 99-880 / ATCC MYA-4621 / FGSC 9543 / NRRL 43880) TaxID=246409 RepID=I1BV81_RHIO9|nr:hypothetical protein RO3G_04816 [Rhizopus delemar RA 99-880]|eukprot:EIE80111.1 hypothetical protein RO3G_04816 [Rhizopus delemar RA 99-880]
MNLLKLLLWIILGQDITKDDSVFRNIQADSQNSLMVSIKLLSYENDTLLPLTNTGGEFYNSVII